MGAHAHEVARSVVDVLRVSLLEDATRVVEEHRRLLDRWDDAQSEGRGTVCAVVDVAHRPTVDRLRASWKESGTVKDADGSGDVRELDVIEDE